MRLSLHWSYSTLFWDVARSRWWPDCSSTSRYNSGWERLRLTARRLFGKIGDSPPSIALLRSLISGESSLMPLLILMRIARGRRNPNRIERGCREFCDRLKMALAMQKPAARTTGSLG